MPIARKWVKLQDRVQAIAGLRRILLCLGLVAYLAGGAQAHLVQPASETVAIKLCGTHSDRTITLTFGENQAPLLVDESCCGACLLVVVPAPPDIRMPRALPPAAALVLPVRGTHIVRTFSIWPGAPPHGPPAALESMT